MKLCNFPECGNLARARGVLCKSHRQQQLRGTALMPLRVFTPAGQWRGCDFDGCDRKHAAGGLCCEHWRQDRAGKPLAALGRPRRRSKVDGDLKQCTKCLEWLLAVPEIFCYAKNGLDKLEARCKKCRASEARKRKYGLSAEAWNMMFDLQERRCKICGAAASGGSGWQTDHDHSCCPGKETCGRCVRGILCVRCNHGLGWFESVREFTAGLENYLDNPIYWLTEDQERQFEASL